MYQNIELKLKSIGITNLYACIGIPSDDDNPYLDFNSVNFHKHIGFKQVGEFHKCGYKFNHWLNMVWMEKII
ncbi:MAG: GNAT family N-acetyltransferase [Candidatus Gastranaerophilaceae bacterium]